MTDLKNKNFKKAKKELEEIIEAERGKLEIECASSASRIEEINRRVEKIPALEKRLAEIKDELARLVFLKKERVNFQRELYSLSREIRKMERDNLSIEKEGKILASKINLLGPSALQCPICERKLTNPYKAMLMGEIKKRYKEKKEYYKYNLGTIKNSQKRMKFLEDKARETDIILLGKEELERQKKSMISEIEEIKKISSELPKLYERKEYLEKELKEKSFAPLTQKMLKKIQGEAQDSSEFI